jgi:hypothetical protein
MALAAHAGVHAGPPARLYELTTETGMPHLDENLRYAVATEQRCMTDADFVTAFWMLRDVSLQDCTLQPEVGKASAPDAAAQRFVLVCTGGHGTTGSAVWQRTGDDSLAGALHVRLGGKNMTFHQRVKARAIGACAAP